MATFEVSILQNNRPDTSGDVYQQPYSIIDTGAVIDPMVWCFDNSGNKDGLAGCFVVPQNYSTTAELTIQWTTAQAAANDAVFDFSYLTRSAGEDMGAAATDTTDSVTDTHTGTAFQLNTATMTGITSADFAAGDVVPYEFFRDTSDANDTITDTVIVFDVLFRYSDT